MFPPADDVDQIEHPPAASTKHTPEAVPATAKEPDVPDQRRPGRLPWRGPTPPRETGGRRLVGNLLAEPIRRRPPKTCSTVA